MDYGKALRIARAIAGWQQKEVADLARIDSSHISLMEMGKRKPSVQSLERLCKALGVPKHLFMLLGAESSDLDIGDPEEMHRVAESLAHLLFSNARRSHRRTARSS